MKKAAGLVVSMALAVLLSGCVPMAMGAGAAVGVAAAKEGGIPGTIADKTIYLKISDLWYKKAFNLYRRLDLNVQEGRVLITGVVPTADMRVDAVRLAWQVEGVKQVINEIRVEESGGVTGYVTDSIATGNIKTRLTFDKYIQSINYNIDTVAGTVYIMGIAQDQKELQRVLDIARNTRYVKNVVSYVRLRGEIPQGLATPAGLAPAAAPAPVDAVESVPINP